MNRNDGDILIRYTKEALTILSLKADLQYSDVVITSQEILSAFDKVQSDHSYTSDQVDAIACFIATLYD